jgi:hypothetical protein
MRKKPEWATGDPFFDTMAGMDTPEYHDYHNHLIAISGASASSGAHADDLVSSTAAISIVDGNQQQLQRGLSVSSSATTTAPSSQQQPADATTGLEHWNRTREQWTKGRWHVVQSANSHNPALNAIHPGNHDAIYDSLVYDRKRLSKPIPLPLVVSRLYLSIIY